MNRRAFLARLGFGTVAAAAAATGVIDIEKLLWVPGEKTIFLPPSPTIATLGETLHIGDVFTIAGRYAINPRTYRTTQWLQQFVVTATVAEGKVLTSDIIRPLPLHDGPYQNVSKSVPRRIDARDINAVSWGGEPLAIKVSWITD